MSPRSSKVRNKLESTLRSSKTFNLKSGEFTEQFLRYLLSRREHVSGKLIGIRGNFSRRAGENNFIRERMHEAKFPNRIIGAAECLIPDSRRCLSTPRKALRFPSLGSLIADTRYVSTLTCTADKLRSSADKKPQLKTAQHIGEAVGEAWQRLMFFFVFLASLPTERCSRGEDSSSAADGTFCANKLSIWRGTGDEESRNDSSVVN